MTDTFVLKEQHDPLGWLWVELRGMRC